MASDVCRVTLTGRLTRDAELRHTPSGTPVLSMRLAYTTNHKINGQWTDKANFIDLTMWGNRAEAIAQYLDRGKQLVIDGRLEWREWEAQDGSKRQSYEVVVDELVMVSSKEGGGSSSNSSGDFQPPAGATNEFVPSGAADDFGGTDDDIPF